MNRFRSLLIIPLIALVLFGGQTLLAAGSSPTIDRHLDAPTSDILRADSLRLSPAEKGEGSLQYYLDSLGYDIDVVNDELGLEVFCGLDGVNMATMVIEVAGSAVYATSGYYEAGQSYPRYQIFGPTNVPGDSVSFTFATFDSIGFYMSPNLPGENNLWFSEPDLNSDNFDHAWVYATGVPHEYLICFEDLPNGGDADYQDLVIKIRFANDAPEITLPSDYTVILCSPEEICFDVTAVDPNCEIDSLWLEMTSGEGYFAPMVGVAEISGTHCFTPSAAGIYSFTFEAEDILGAITSETLNINVQLASTPEVTIGDTSLALCEPEEVCLPVSVFDPDCDIVSISTNYGDYTGTMSDFDQVLRLNQLGGSVTQIGGGYPGKTLNSAADFVGPANSQSGVSVTLPNFVHADHVVDYGSFPSGTSNSNSAYYMLGAPTALTFTTAGAGGPDGGPGDGSVSFNSGNRCTLGFPEDITTCHGAHTDLVIFTNTGGSGSGRLYFRNNGSTVLDMTMTIPNGASASGAGGITLDLPDGLTFDEIKIKCVSGSFQIDALACRTEPSTTNADVCFTVDTAGIYEIIITAVDSCGNEGVDTATVTVAMNSAPVANAGADFSRFMCAFEEICFDVAFSDPDDNLALTELYSGPGSLVGDQVCFTPTTTGAFTFVLHAVDECGLQDYDTVVVTITDNDPPVADNPSPMTVAQCEAEEICRDFTAGDPNGGTLTWSHLAGVGSITPGGHFCFTPTITGSYPVAVVVTDSCGLADTASMTFNVVVNTAPVAFEPVPPAPRFQCVPEQICHHFSATDAEGGYLEWQMLSSFGSLTLDGVWCFTPGATDTYSATVVVTDTCGAADTTYIAYEVTLNSAPYIAFGNDTTLMLCAPQEVCLGYTVADADGLGGLTEIMLSGYGALDAANDRVCFTPTTGGSYQFIVSVTDSCGVSDVDTVVANVSFGATAAITCPANPIEVFLCQADDVCQTLAISPASADVSVSYGTYNAGELCFAADTSGTYDITVIADEACGADTCQLSFVVEIGQAAQIDCPDPSSRFICQAESVCVPVGVFGTGVTTTVTPIGTYSSGNVCFPADTTGHYEITVIADTDCGSDTCLVVVDVSINSAPVAVQPMPQDTFLCVGGQVCYQFEATDADGGTLTWSRLGGNGTVSGGGEWCFTVSGTGTYSVTATVVDECGAADTITHEITATVNSSPTVDLGADTSIFACITGEICLPYEVYDADDNIVAVELVSGGGYLNEPNSTLCFTPPVDANYRFIVRVEDACGVNAYDTINIAVDLNQPPTVDAGDDQTVFSCALNEICWPVSSGDPDGNLASVVLTGPGAYDGSSICFTPTGTYNYEFILTATDDCGLEVVDTVAIYYTLNSPPVANAGADQTKFQCTPTQICWAASCSDVDGNLTGCALIAGPGSYDGSSICFTPGATGTYQFALEATDACGASDTDYVTIDVTINSAPVCTVPNDTTIFQCTAEEVCLPAFGTDVDNNLAFCQIVSGPGTLDGGNWCYTPVTDQTVTVVLHCQDQCLEMCESAFTINFDINGPPEIAFGGDMNVFQCTPTEICLPFTAGDPDDPRLTTTTLVSGSGDLDVENSTVCFTPAAAGTYTFVLRIEDECGLFDQDTINVNVALNSAPVANAGADQTLFLCDSTTSVCWPAGCSDVDGNLTDCLFNGPGTYDGSEICFIPVVTGSYIFSLRAVDACGLQMADTVIIDVTINSDPTVAFGSDTSLFLCTPQQVCVNYSVDDADGPDGLVEDMISGFGAIDTAANTVCFTPTTAGDYEIVVGVTDSCGAVGADTIVVSVAYGTYANINCPSGAFNRFKCGPDSIVQSLGVTPAGATVETSFGVYAAGAVRFQADTAGMYAITVIASSSCGADTCEMVFNVAFNSAPVANAGADQTLFQCVPTAICWPASCSDVDGNLTTCELYDGPLGSSYNGSQICFTPDATGSYAFVLRAVDACGFEDFDTAVVNVTLNSSPTITAQADTTLFQCTPAEICVSYTTDDPDGPTGLIEEMVSGFGTIDTDANTVCFTPSADGTYEFVVSVTDPCGVVATDTVLVTVTLGVTAAIDCPTEVIDVFLCESDSIHQTLDITPDSADVSVSYGVYADGQLHFLADTSGTYVITVIAEVECGADTCEVTFDVEIGEAAQIDCPAPASRFLCQPQNICLPLGVYGAGAVVTVTPIGSYASGTLCFPADTAGHYEIQVIAATDCGTDTCVVVRDITINSAPVAVDPTTPVDTFRCTTGQICYQFEASDVDGQDLSFARLSGNGSVSADGLWCFNAGGGGTYSVTVVVSDECSAADTTSLTYHVVINSAPVVTLGNDTTVFVCDGDSYCFNYGVADADGNVTTEVLLAATGSIDTETDEVCFTPDVSGTYQFIVQAVDACGALDADTINVTITLGTGVTVTCPADTAVHLCGPAEICRPVQVSANATSVVASYGTYDNGQVCFDADTIGHYEISVHAESSCGSDSCQFAVDVTFNGPPVAVEPPPVDTFICAAAQFTLQLEADDPDGDDLEWIKISGNGAVSSDGVWTFNVPTSGVYTMCARVYDDCGGADTVCATYTVTRNTAPVITFTRSTHIFQCNSEEICLNYTTSDVDDNIVLEELYTGPGYIDTLGNQVCFTPDTSGYYFFDIRVTDACGATDLDTLGIFLELNLPPTADAGGDRTVFQCSQEELCWPAGCYDPDDNLAECYVVDGLATCDGSEICFMPDTAGVYTLILRAVDECGVTDEDTVVVTIELNAPPVCQLPDDAAFFQCAPAQVSLPVSGSDPDQNFDHCEMVTGQGSIVGGNWVYTPTADQSFWVKIMCLDQCGASCVDSFHVSFDINRAPVVDVGEDQVMFLCAPTTVCWPVTVTDDDNNIATIELVSANGQYNQGTGEICFNVPQGDRSYPFVIKATDSCGAVAYDTASLTIQYNSAPDPGLPPDMVAYLDSPGSVCFDINPVDPDDNLTSITVQPFGSYSTATGRICFDADSSGEYCLIVTAADDCPAYGVDTICIQVVIDECMHVQIEKTHEAIQGQIETVSVFLNGSGKQLGAYDFLLAYDASALTVHNVFPGELVEDCGWEYFTWRFGSDGNCGGGCPSGLLRLVAIAETNNGANHPGCYLEDNIGSLADIDFLVSDDRTLECQYVPVRFLWLDCGDNSFSSRLGDTLWVSRKVFDFEGHDMADNSAEFPTYLGAPDTCLVPIEPGKPQAIRCIDFTNGGVDIVCADSIDARGDVNLNDLPYEIADAVLFSNYFIYGLQVFTVNPNGQIAATDVNADGIVLSVADLVYLIRVVVGDASALPKLNPDLSTEVELVVRGGVLEIVETDYEIGAISLVLEGEVEPTLADPVCGLQLVYNFDGENTRVLVYDRNGIAWLEAGAVLDLGGSSGIRDIEVGSFEGLMMKTNLSLLPREYSLAQNYPNPFNPTTTIEFGMPEAGDWNLVVYNILGQTVTSWNGFAEAGYMTVKWDAGRHASGIYFYKLQVGDFTATKKMVLLK